jgi:hypothetical protein
MADLRIDIASEFVGVKAFKQADTATATLSKQVNRLAKQYLGLLGAQKLVRASYNAAKAFAEDDAAAQKLANSVKNLGLAYANDDIRKYVDSLTLATGVADNLLRPALQSLLQVTGSVSKAQELLGAAIDISRGSGEDLATVSNDLSQAYVGNLKGLRKYNLGLTQAELKASSFADIQARLNSLFAGSSAIYLKTYAGQMQILTNTAKEAQEVIGKDLVDALILLSGNTGVEGLATDMQNLATFTGDAIYGLGVLIDKLNNLGGLKQIGGLMGLLQLNPVTGLPISILAALAEVGSSAKAAKGAFNFASGGGLGTGSIKGITDRQAAAAEKLAKKRQLEILNAQKQQLKIAKEQTALQKAGTLFDIQQAGIIAALKGKITDEERTRLELQLAILTGNTSEASKLAGELAKSQGLSAQLAAYLADLPDAKNPFTGWKSYLDMLEAQVRMIAGIQPGAPATNVPANMGNPQGIYPLQPGSQGNFDYGQNNAPTYVEVTIDGTKVADAVTKVQTNGYLSGKIIALERIQSQFG